MKKSIKTSYMFDKVKKHICDNFNFYIIMSIFFLIGIISGILFYNNINNEIQEPINNYIHEFITTIKAGYEIDYTELLKQVILNHIIYAGIIWFIGCTLIGMPIVYSLITWKGFSLSYCIASIISSLGIRNGIVFCFLSLFLQNIIIIPAILGLGVSGNKLYKSILQDRRKENLKISLIKHTIFSLIMLVFLIMSAFIEAYISTNMGKIYISNSTII